MFAVRSTNSQAGVWLATMLAASILPTLGHAYSAEEQQACSGDAFRLCSAEIPDVDRVTVCRSGTRPSSRRAAGCSSGRAPKPVKLRMRPPADR
jgi:hypothetical protein